MSEPKLTAKSGDTLAAVARLSGSESHKGYDIIHEDGYSVAYVIPIDEDGSEGGELARQFAAAPELLEALEVALGDVDTMEAAISADASSYDAAGMLNTFGHMRRSMSAAIAKARGGEG